MRRTFIGIVLAALVMTTAGARVAMAGGVPLIDAVRKGDVVAVRTILKSTDVNAALPDGSTALQWAVYRDDIAMVDLLIKAGANVRAANRFGATSLWLAAVNGNAAIIERLLAAKADINEKSSGGETLLMVAARTGRPDAVNMLIRAGVDVNAREAVDGQTALMWAAARNNAEVVKALIEAGADIKLTSTGSRVKQPMSIIENDFETMVNRSRPAEAFKSFKSPKAPAFTAFDYAVRDGHIAAVKALLDAGVDVNRELEDGSTPLLRAIYNNHYELAMVLLDRGANAKADKIGWTPLHQVALNRRPNPLGPGMPWAIPTGTVDSLDLMKRLVSLGVDVNARMVNDINMGSRRMFSRFGATAFHLSAKGCDGPAMNLLLSLGADPKAKTDGGDTALGLAGGNNIWGPGEDPGTEEACLEAARIAYETAPESINEPNITGDIPLHGAVLRGYVKLVDFLIEKGSKLDARNDRNWTPWTIADGVFYGSHLNGRPAVRVRLDKIMAERGISTADMKYDTTNFDCRACSLHAVQADKETMEKWRLEREQKYGKAEQSNYIGADGEGAAEQTEAESKK